MLLLNLSDEFDRLLRSQCCSTKKFENLSVSCKILLVIEVDPAY